MDGKVFLCKKAPTALWEITERVIYGINSDVPAYDSSLDCCATFEATLTEKVDQADYATQIIQQINHDRHGEFRFMGASQFNQMTATPSQRCRAFLAVRGLAIPEERTP